MRVHASLEEDAQLALNVVPNHGGTGATADLDVGQTPVGVVALVVVPCRCSTHIAWIRFRSTVHRQVTWANAFPSEDEPAAMQQAKG